MDLTRRQALAMGTSLAAAAMVPFSFGTASAATEETQKLIDAFTGGKAPEKGKITLTAPEIAENGNTVPVSVNVESEMSEASHVAAVMILADGNPNPAVATFNFTPMSGEATATTRMRLAKTQQVIAIAKMNDGSVFMDSKEVKVTIGGCGG